MLSALIELALEHAEDRRLGFRSIGPQLFTMLRRGEVDAVREALVSHSMTLPREPVAVLALARDSVTSSLRDSLERASSSPGTRLFPVGHAGQLLLLTERRAVEQIATRLQSEGVSAGLAVVDKWAHLDDGVRQAVVASRGAREGGILSFDEMMDGTVLGLLARAEITELAHLRLAGLVRTEDGRKLLHEAAVWLRHSGSWDPAARELHLHRHTLKQRMSALAEESALELSTFPGRAALWAMLVALDATDVPADSR